jgi:hypothetical protein
MTRSMIELGLVVSTVSLLGSLASASAVAEDRSIWQGKYSASERASFAHVEGDNWIEINRSGSGTVRIPYREVTRTADFIELEMIGRPLYRIRVYSDRIETKSTSRADRWIEIATGRWTE